MKINVSVSRCDLAEMDAKVADLRRRGWHKANRSQLIRLAIRRVDLDQVAASIHDAEMLSALRGGES